VNPFSRGLVAISVGVVVATLVVGLGFGGSAAGGYFGIRQGGTGANPTYDDINGSGWFFGNGTVPGQYVTINGYIYDTTIANCFYTARSTTNDPNATPPGGYWLALPSSVNGTCATGDFTQEFVFNLTDPLVAEVVTFTSTVGSYSVSGNVSLPNWDGPVSAVWVFIDYGSPDPFSIVSASVTYLV
jgi:hypothetical protein